MRLGCETEQPWLLLETVLIEWELLAGKDYCG